MNRSAKGVLGLTIAVAVLSVGGWAVAAAGVPAPPPGPPEAAGVPGPPPAPEAPPLVYVSEEGERIFLPPFGKHGAFLGVATVDLTPELCEHFGLDAKGAVMVSKVVDDSPAEKAGVQVGDILLSVDGKPVKRGLGLISKIASRKEGEAVTLELWRDGRRVSVEATLAGRSASVRSAFLPGGERSYDIKIFGDRDDGDDGDEEEIIVRTPRVIHIKKLLEDLDAEGGEGNVWVERLREVESERQQQLQKRIEELEKKLQALEEKMNKSN